MFHWDSNVQLGGYILKINDLKLTVMHVVENTVSIFFNDISKIPIVNQMIPDQKEKYNIFGYGIYHKPHSIFK